MAAVEGMLQSGNTIVAVSKAVQESFRATLHLLCRFGFEASGKVTPETADLLDSIASSLACEHLAMLEQLQEAATLPERTFTRVIDECRDQLFETRSALIDDFKHGMHEGKQVTKEPFVSFSSHITNSPGAVQQTGVGTLTQTVSEQTFAPLLGTVEAMLRSPEVAALGDEKRQALVDTAEVVRREAQNSQPEPSKVKRWSERLIGLAREFGLNVAADAVLEALKKVVLP
jgi:hypothetical protein